jgi:hypothetical protein
MTFQTFQVRGAFTYYGQSAAQPPLAGSTLSGGMVVHAYGLFLPTFGQAE